MIHVIHGIWFSWCCVDVLVDYDCRVIVCLCQWLMVDMCGVGG